MRFHNCEFLCSIDANDGIILDYEFDGTLPCKRTIGRILGQSEIRAILFLMAETINGESIEMQMDESADDGQAVYEGTASGAQYDYEFEFQIIKSINSFYSMLHYI